MFPQYDIARGLYVLYINANIREICTEDLESFVNCERQEIVYAMNGYSTERGGIGQYLIALGLLCPISFAILALIEHELSTAFLRKWWKKHVRCCRSKIDPGLGMRFNRTYGYLRFNRNQPTDRNQLIVFVYKILCVCYI